MLPTAFPGHLHRVMLAVARAAGETAPLLFTALFSDFWTGAAMGQPDLMKPTASLAVLIYNFSGSPFENQIAMAWSAALCWCSLCSPINLIGQSLWPDRRIRSLRTCRVLPNANGPRPSAHR